MSKTQSTSSPIDGKNCATVPLSAPQDLAAIVAKGQLAFSQWKLTSVEKRCEIIEKMAAKFLENKDDIGREITVQMGRPIRYTPNEAKGMCERALYMAKIAPESLAVKKVVDADRPGFNRFIKREPLGIVLVIPAWNYPLLTAINGVVPAILSGNVVILKHSQQTPLCAERLLQAFTAAGLPDGVLQVAHMSHATTDELIKDPAVQFVNFTGSVSAGHKIYESVAKKFIGCGLELGGVDPGYVRADANLEAAVDTLIDGAMFNSGQCCCGIQRIYVHESLYDEFVKKSVALTEKYILGDPLDPNTTLGPLVKATTTDEVFDYVKDAESKGAKQLVSQSLFPKSKAGTNYCAPQILVNVDHTMKVMQEECFGPIVGIMKVKSDEEAIKLMNDSKYGLTASIWTQDEAAAVRIGDQVETGTVFQNRCDYVDPGLAWTGVKDTGFGVTLSAFGFLQLTRAKSFHLKQL